VTGSAAGAAADLALIVTDVTDLAPGIRQLTLRAPDGRRLPSYPPGSHLGLRWRADRVNSYSLTGNGDRPPAYTVSVLRTCGSRGGSAWAHGLTPGAAITAVPPRSGFTPAARARRHLLVAGGIGITPLLSHVRWHRRWGGDFALYYAHKPGRAAHLDELTTLCGDRLRSYDSRAGLWADLGPALSCQPLGTQLYVCGPMPMIEEVTARAQRLHWAGSRVRFEAFAAAADGPREPFRVTLASSGQSIAVAAQESLLEALERVGVEVPSMCRSGVCGECRTQVRSGRPDHRDLVLSAAEKAAGNWIMPCVSRAAGAELELSDATTPQPRSPQLIAAQPPANQPPVTQPPVAQPLVTQPPVAQSPVAQPPAPQPPATLRDFPFPLATDAYRYTANLQPGGRREVTAAGTWGETITRVGPDYAAFIAERAAILDRDPGRLIRAPHMAAAEWDTLGYLMRHLAAEYPAHFTLAERPGGRVHWVNRLLGVTADFVSGEESTLPSGTGPLEFIGRQVVEDLVLMDEREGRLWVDAGLVTFASGWSFPFVAGMTFQEIHGPVPRANADGVFARAEAFLLRLQPGAVFRRLNWAFQAGRFPDHSLDDHDTWATEAARILRTTRDDRELAGQVYLRVELQHLTRLATSAAVLFLIETRFLSLAELAAVPEWAARVISVLTELPQDIADYKGISGLRGRIIACLRALAAR
jgi:ferredoxin-NADP reductase